MDPNKKRAFELHQEGKSFSEIGEVLNIAKTTAHGWVKEVELNERYSKRYPNAPDVRSSSSFGTYGTQNAPNQARNETERSTSARHGKVRVKEPAYIAEQRGKIVELEERTSQLTSQLITTRRKQIEQLKRRFKKVHALMVDNDGEIWTIDELTDCAEDLESIREDMLDIDPDESEWIEFNLSPLLLLLNEASESLTDEDMDEGEIFFFED